MLSFGYFHATPTHARTWPMRRCQRHRRTCRPCSAAGHRHLCRACLTHMEQFLLVELHCAHIIPLDSARTGHCPLRFLGLGAGGPTSAKRRRGCQYPTWFVSVQSNHFRAYLYALQAPAEGEILSRTAEEWVLKHLAGEALTHCHLLVGMGACIRFERPSAPD